MYHSGIDYSGDVVNYNILSDNMADNATYYDEFFFLINNYSLSDISLSVKQTIQNNKKDVIKGIFYRFYKSSFSRVGAWYYPSDNLYQKILYTLFFKLPLLLGVFYILLFLYMIRLIRLYIKTRTPDINAALIWSCIVSNIIVMIVGAQGEWDRLILPVLPFIYILTGNYLENFRYPFKLK